MLPWRTSLGYQQKIDA
ncbi:hypothetical protein AVEN_274254-1, partial [Araneus ventricosus]